MLTFVHEGRKTSSNVLLHPYVRDVRSSSFTAFAATTCLTSPTSYWNTSVVATSFAVTHLQLLTTGLRPGTQQLTYFRRLSTNSLVAFNSVCVIVSKIRPFLRANKVLLGRFFFLTLDGFLKICSCQNSQLHYFEHL
jgi:hypothetical protein